MKTKIASILIQIIILAACLYYLFTGIDWSSLAATFAGYSPWRMIGVLCMTGPIFWIMGIRLSQLTNGAITTMTGVKGTVLATGINNVLPARLGEVVKAVYFKQQTSLGFSQSMGIIFLERLMDMNMVALTALVTALVFGLGYYGLPLVLAVLACWAGLFVLIRRMPDSGFELAFVPSQKLRYFLKKISIALHDALKRQTIVAPMGATVLIWIFNFAYLILMPQWLMQMDLTSAQLLGIIASVYLGLSIPGLPGGIGMTEGAMVVVLSWTGLPKTEALAIALTVRAYNFIPPTILGMTVFATSGMDVHSLKPSDADLS